MLGGVVFKLRDLGLMKLTGSMVIHVRGKGHLNRPRIRNPHWFLRKKLSNRLFCRKSEQWRQICRLSYHRRPLRRLR
ncbi:uncharacterized protein LOC6494135 isoform X2 [Drosophila ananassae]|uniref:uncharacterized protein LOC6494135 isoform X2 n=1 Tax=Drosophila ananassae TaxID=7217 RepID=UPI0013A5DF3E|nr:uncharacterized protein LOC6494135 isoform X2 [Drosophila ananassae]